MSPEAAPAQLRRIEADYLPDDAPAHIVFSVVAPGTAFAMDTGSAALVADATTDPTGIDGRNAVDFAVRVAAGASSADLCGPWWRKRLEHWHEMSWPAAGATFLVGDEGRQIRFPPPEAARGLDGTTKALRDLSDAWHGMWGEPWAGGLPGKAPRPCPFLPVTTIGFAIGAIPAGGAVGVAGRGLAHVVGWPNAILEALADWYALVERMCGVNRWPRGRARPGTLNFKEFAGATFRWKSIEPGDLFARIKALVEDLDRSRAGAFGGWAARGPPLGRCPSHRPRPCVVPPTVYHPQDASSQPTLRPTPRHRGRRWRRTGARTEGVIGGRGAAAKVRTSGQLLGRGTAVLGNRQALAGLATPSG